ncbi:hypothetical protein BS78_02G214300 [Paspalum vaginatum]|nr:hypothetical protein BS78_02G214300 [Paspalum vaginatum]KAJ1290071.1 hypothetical protein BS78_02G214300 [Paspalum vaginatum]
MRRAGVLLALLLCCLPALCACAAEPHERRRLGGDSGSAVLLFAGRRWLGGRKADGVAEEGRKGANEGTGANQEADAPADAVHDSGKGRKGSATHHARFPASRHGGETAAVAPEVLGMDYNYKLDAHRHRPINNDAPLVDELAETP